MNYSLPETLEVGGREVPILWDYRPLLDVVSALSDNELSDTDKLCAALYIFYPTLDDIYSSDIKEAIQKMFWFINGGADSPGQKGPKLMNWGQDLPYIIAPINRVLGKEIRREEPLHWWTFLSAYMEIGDCTFAQIVRIRDLKARGKKMDKPDREWYNQHRELVDFKNTYTEEDKKILDFLAN